MWITETDREVEKFHPVCAQAIEEALKLLLLDEQYKVEHHRYVGSLEMDLVISNRETSRILCVVEVKRTIPAVYSTRYQYQAMSYVQSLRDIEKEKNYYILTNLECSCLFRYSPDRPNAYDQLLEPGYRFNSKFEDIPESEFRQRLTMQFREMISLIISNNTDYVLSYSEFAANVKENMPFLLKWNTSLAFLFYQYIRGSFNGIGRNELADIRSFRNDIYAICREASRVDFSGIFGFDDDKYDNHYHPQSHLLAELHKLGRNYKDADIICNIMHHVISEGHEHEGEVPTDIELARTLVSLIKTFCEHISENENICDPAAGSGTLISATVQAYPELKPTQIKVNDINTKLIQLLTLRMGLNFASIVDRNFFPEVSTSNIADLDQSYFENTKIIVLNPPYYSAVAPGCIEKKQELSRKIRLLSRKPSITSIGQSPLECPFIELITTFAKIGTVIACILPNTHITALGDSEVAFRRFLLNDFGLNLIFNYPLTGLFNSVAQNTSIFIGIKGSHPERIKFIHSLGIVSEINQDIIPEIVSNLIESEKPEDVADGFSGFLVDRSLLLNSVSDGWKFLDSNVLDAITYLEEHVYGNPLFHNITESEYAEYYRGKVGNSGGSDLLYINRNEAFFEEVQAIVSSNLKAGLRNADYNQFFVGNGDNLFYDASQATDEDLLNVSTIYAENYSRRNTRQSVRDRTPEQYVSILKRESRNYVPAHTAILSRASRRLASTYVTTDVTFLSTNFFAFETSSLIDAKILASWMGSIFYQIQLEVVCKNQNGMRKIEAENVNRTYIPNLSQMTDEQKELINNTEVSEFFNLRNPSIRPIDRAWARVITGSDDVDEMLNEAIRYISILSNIREH